MTISPLTRPEPLADFLDRGGNPRELLGQPYFDRLVESIELNAMLTADRRERSAWLLRAVVERSLAGESFGELPPITDQTSLTEDAWTADLLDDLERIGPRLTAFLDPDERANVERRICGATHPNPFDVDRLAVEAWCSACGDLLDVGEVVLRIGHQTDPEVGDLTEPVDGQWCFACVTIAAEAMKAARG